MKHMTRSRALYSLIASRSFQFWPIQTYCVEIFFRTSGSRSSMKVTGSKSRSYER